MLKKALGRMGGEIVGNGDDVVRDVEADLAFTDVDGGGAGLTFSSSLLLKIRCICDTWKNRLDFTRECMIKCRTAAK